MSAGSSGSDQEFELNLAPIIDCFTVLITYLLVSASFLTLGSLDVTLPSVADAEQDQTVEAAKAEEPGLNLRIHLRKGGTIEFGLSGKGGDTEQEVIASVPGAASSGTWNFERLAKKVEAVKAGNRVPAGVVFSADREVRYKEVVQAVEIARSSFPGVALTRKSEGE